MSPYTSFLFADPSFLEGVGRIIDIGGTMSDYNYAPITRDEAVAVALCADARAVQADFRAAVAATLDEIADRLEATVAAAA